MRYPKDELHAARIKRMTEAEMLRRATRVIKPSRKPPHQPVEVECSLDLSGVIEDVVRELAKDAGIVVEGGKAPARNRGRGKKPAR